MNAQYARPSDNKSPSATWSTIAGALSANYPVANISDLSPTKPIIATGTSWTGRATFGVAQTIRAILIVKHNLVGATVTLSNNGGMAPQAITIFPNLGNGHSINAFKDLSAVAGNNATQWDLAITGAAANVHIGEVLLLEEWRTFERNVNWGLREYARQGVKEHRTDGGVRLVKDLGFYIRGYRGELWASDTGKAELLSLARDARNNVKNWPFLLDPAAVVLDPLFLHFTNAEIEQELRFINWNPTAIALEEESRGLTT